MKSLLPPIFSAAIAGFGAMACITLLAYLEHLDTSIVWLMAPFGATMVILFGLPSSPLAQPRNILFGHLITSAVGMIVLHTLGVSPLSLGLAVGLGIFCMLITETTHPPAGANPLVIMLTGQSWQFLLFPVGIGALAILGFGLIYHRLISRREYPAAMRPHS
ncbi:MULTISPECIES: HPP family protein [Chromohalobacter]|jgi:CBS-domain-containing membrane protein|nr:MULTISPECIES: HPP family protein [Chromohalobacter]